MGIDRPGYGEASPIGDEHWATVDGAADDLATVLVGERTGPVGVVGWDAGGRVALALAARHPNLVDRVAVVATPAPHEEVPWIPIEWSSTLSELTDAPASIARRRLDARLRQDISRSQSQDRSLRLLHASAADQSVVADPERLKALDRMLKLAFAQGTQGYAADVAGFCLRPWGFGPKEVEAKTLLLYGSKDPVCALAHGRWWQTHLPNARLEMSPGAGHLLIFPLWGRILSHLAPGAKRTGGIGRPLGR